MGKQRLAILALDLGNNTGWAVASPSGVDGGGWCNVTSRAQYAERYLRFKVTLEQMHRRYGGFQAVYYEHVNRHMSGDSAHVYGGYLALLQMFCHKTGTVLSSLSVSEVKKGVAGRGNADKNAVMDAVVRKGWVSLVQNDDHADALAILDFALRRDFNSSIEDHKKATAGGILPTWTTR